MSAFTYSLLWGAVALNAYTCIRGIRLNRKLARLEKEMRIQFMKNMMRDYQQMQRAQFQKLKESADELPIFVHFGREDDDSKKH